MSGLSNAMFAGVRIIELAQFVFVPGATAVLADLGAEVIKIEMVDGDPYRKLNVGDGRQTKSVNVSVEQNNRGKKSVALDLKTDAGRELLLKLVETADVFLTSIRPGSLSRLLLSVDALRARNPRLIYAHGNAVGFRGEEVNRAGYDASAFWSRGGFADVLAAPGQPPVTPRPALGDHIGSMNLAFGIAAALFNRERTGKPSTVEVSLLSSALWVLSSDVTTSLQSGGQIIRGMPSGMPALRRNYQTADRRWILLMFLDAGRNWPGLCERIGRPELVQDPRFIDEASRNANNAALMEIIAAAFRSRTLAEWRKTLRGFDAPWEIVQSIEEVAADPQAHANGYLFGVEATDGTDVTLVTGPVAFNGSAAPDKPRRAPLTGEHTIEVLRSVGVSQQHLDACKKRNILVG